MKELQTQYDSQRRKVDVDNFDVTVRELVRMVEEGEIDRAPEYQRKFRWDEVRESRLLESVLLGLPVPTIFVATNKDGTWELVDGLQRISSLVHFMGDEKKLESSINKKSRLRLTGLEKLSSFNDKTLEELPDSIQLQLMKRALRVTSLSDKSDMEVRYDTFERLNTGGIALSPQEIRACVYQGPFIDLLEQLASNSDLSKIIKLQRGHREDGTLEEFVLKIFAYSGARDKFDGRVTHFLNEFAMLNQSPASIKKMADEFHKVISAILNITKGPILKKNYSVTPLNLAEAIFSAGLEIVREKKILRQKKDGLRIKHC